MRQLIFTYSPAGLGHLRVTGALVAGRPKGHNYELVGSSDPFVTKIHRLASVTRLGIRVQESFQYGLLEDLFTRIYVWYLTHNTSEIYRNLLHIIAEQPDAEAVTVIATHFGLAHQIAAIKGKIKRKTGKHIDLVVQVTDDSSQHIWCVKGADITFVPSRLTRDELNKFAKNRGIRINTEVSPYPTSPSFSEVIKGSVKRSDAFSKGSDESINVIVPISGAAVGLDYLTRLMNEADRISKRFRFWVVAKRSNHTKQFLSEVGKLRWVQLITGRSDNETVGLYEKVYRENVMHIEITKPSEQSFKSLISPDMVGGSILFFTEPVGRQEWDNIAFMKRHKILVDADVKDLKVEDERYYPRGMRIPNNPENAARLMVKYLDNGFFEKMTRDFSYSPESMMTSEISERGTWLFWEKLRVLGLI